MMGDEGQERETTEGKNGTSEDEYKIYGLYILEELFPIIHHITRMHNYTVSKGTGTCIGILEFLLF